MKKSLLILLYLPIIGFGQCISGDCYGDGYEIGKGTYTFSNGEEVKGLFENGKFDPLKQ